MQIPTDNLPKLMWIDWLATFLESTFVAWVVSSATPIHSRLFIHLKIVSMSFRHLPKCSLTYSYKLSPSQSFVKT